jgi:Holliday junction resolvasome RuvABC endonuclease subunit
VIAAQQLDTLNPQQMRQALELLLADVAAKDELIRQRERGTLLLGQARGAAVAALARATPLQRRAHAQYRKGRVY